MGSGDRSSNDKSVQKELAQASPEEGPIEDTHDLGKFVSGGPPPSTMTTGSSVMPTAKVYKD